MSSICPNIKLWRTQALIDYITSFQLKQRNSIVQINELIKDIIAECV